MSGTSIRRIHKKSRYGARMTIASLRRIQPDLPHCYPRIMISPQSGYIGKTNMFQITTNQSGSLGALYVFISQVSLLTIAGIKVHRTSEERKITVRIRDTNKGASSISTKLKIASRFTREDL